MPVQYTQAQQELLDFIQFNNPEDIAIDIMLIHDMALYHSDYTIDIKERTALYQLKQVADILIRMSQEKNRCI
jgi:hypothetical protein